MSHKDKIDPDGIRSDGVPYYEADAKQLKSYVDARNALSEFSVPVLIHSNNPHEYLYIAAFDGTGNDKFKDPNHETNVAEIDDQIKALRRTGNERFGRGYVPGPGTEDHFIPRVLDGAEGYTYDARAETGYKWFIDQAWKWKHADPQAQIRVVGVCFSRGCDDLVGFTRIVQERGIQDPVGARYTYNLEGLVAHATYARPPLVAPGKVAQVVGMFDPVSTGAPMRDEDRRLPPSVISGLQIIAADERRNTFKSDHIIDPGMTPDGRFLAVTVAGAHSDIGGSYHRDGLAIRSYDLMASFLNGVSDQPFLEYEPVPHDPRLDVVHHSEDGMLVYRILPKVNRANPNGYNELLVPRGEMKDVADPFNAEPRDELLNAQFERHRVAIDAPAMAKDQVVAPPTADLSSRLDRLLAAGQANDWSVFSQENHALAFGAAGQAMWNHAQAQAEWQEQQTLQQAATQQAMQQSVQRTGPVLQH